MLNSDFAQKARNSNITAILKEQPNSRKIAIWGTGCISEILSSYVSQFISISFYISKDVESQRIFLDKPVYLIDEVRLSPEEHFVVVLADRRFTEIREALRSKGFAEGRDYLDIIDSYEPYPVVEGSRIAYWDTLFDYSDETIPIESRFETIGYNSGNLVHWHALKKSIKMNSFSDLNLEKLKTHDMVITAGFICITQGADFLWASHVLDAVSDKPVIPISLGIASAQYTSDFKIHKNVVRILKRISERCKLIGVRGAYTAEILEKYGIKNTKVIGCPSLYYPFLRRGLRGIERSGESLRVVANSAGIGMNSVEKTWFDYISSENLPFVDQTLRNCSVNTINDGNRYKTYLRKNMRFFMSIDEWEAFIRNFNFSIGMRFHGNIVPIWNGIPSLFLIHDSRTREMCEFFHLPYIEISDFDSEKSLEYYYEVADYSEFNKAMPKLLEEYKDFLKCNGIIIE